MLDFTSALYLGFEHASLGLAGWRHLTLGKPAALEETPGTDQLEQNLAALTGCQQVVLGPSTLHLFCDLFAMFGGENVVILMDGATYPITRWGMAQAAIKGTRIHTYVAHSLTSLAKQLAKVGAAKPVIVTDGYAPGLGSMAPLRQYAACAAKWKGILVVDDTQALGIFGRRTESSCPYGAGGGGSLRHFDLHLPRVVVVSSLAKAFGAPLAMLGGNRRLIRRFESASGTRMHCSQPSAADMSAARMALKHNAVAGDDLRCRLAERVMRFRSGVSALLATNSLFPVQPLRLPARIGAESIHRALLERSIRTVLHKEPGELGLRLSFVLRANHSDAEIDYALKVLRMEVEGAGRRSRSRTETQCELCDPL